MTMRSSKLVEMQALGDASTCPWARARAHGPMGPGDFGWVGSGIWARREGLERSKKVNLGRKWVETEDEGKSSCEKLRVVPAVLLVVVVCQNTASEIQSLQKYRTPDFRTSGIYSTPRIVKTCPPGLASPTCEEACRHFELRQTEAHSEVRSEKVRKEIRGKYIFRDR